MSEKVWTLIIQKSIDNLCFGESRALVHKKTGNPGSTFLKTLFSKSKTEQFEDFHIFYTENDALEAVEIFGSMQIKLQGKQIYPGTLTNAKTLIPDLTYVDGSYISKSCSIGVSVTDDNQIESILVAGPHYYD